MLSAFLRSSLLLFCILSLSLFTGCERDLEELEPASFPVNPNVFIDGFSGGLEYAAFGGSDVTAFQVDNDVTYSGTASMRFEVPDFEDPAGAYAGGTYFTGVGRDLTGFNVLTFWARATQPANLDVVGFGNDLGASTYETTINGLPLTTNWEKYYIPIPDPSKLTMERGMFFYSEGPEDGRGYTFWIDEVKFEDLGTIGAASPVIFNGEDLELTAENGAVFSANPSVVFSLPSGVNQAVNAAPAYFTYTSSNPGVASVSENGTVTLLTEGTATITARLGDTEASGSLTVTSTGEAVGPETAAPTPDYPANEVISLFSDAYEDEPVDFYNGFWEFSTTLSFDYEVEGDNIIRYTDLNFVGIQFTAPTLDITGVDNLRMDIWTPEPTGAGAEFKILLVDIGTDGAFGGNDDSSFEVTITPPVLQSQQWVTLELPLSDFPGLTGRRNLAQIVLSGNIPNVFVDNILFFQEDDGGGGNEDTPTMAAPSPPTRAAEDVISLFSDAYEDVAGSDLNPDWGQATATSVVDINFNPTLFYGGLNYQGFQIGSPVDVSGLEFVHLDVWTANSTELNFYLISPGPVETGYSISVPTDGWLSLDIPLSDFDPVDLAEVIQFKFDGNGDIYLDNIYFYRGDGGGGGDEPNAAPVPTTPAENVISLFSGAYDNVPVDTWRTDWSSADLEDIDIDGNATKKYTNLDFVGIETVANTIDVSSMTHFRLDVWTGDATFFGVKLVDFGADGAFGGGDDVEHQINFEMPAQRQWISYDIPLSDFTGLTTRSNIAQYILVAQPTGGATVYVDNVYFRN